MKSNDFEFLNFDEPAVSHDKPGAADHNSVDPMIGMHCSSRFCPSVGLSPSHYLLIVIVFIQNL